MSDGVFSEALLDTGCCPGSVIDHQFLLKLIKARLRMGRETPYQVCNVNLTLADKVTTQSISKKYWLEFKLMRNGHDPLTFSDWYYPASLAVDLIIGYAALTGPVFPFAMAMYQQQHNLWKDLEHIKGVNTNSLCNILSSMDNGMYSVCDPQGSVGLPTQLLYPDIRNKTAGEVNIIFKRKRVQHSGLFQVTQGDCGLGVRVL
jgi:hypothetical protein